MVNCTKCGQSNAPDRTFCGYCGVFLGWHKPSTSEPVAPPSGPPSDQVAVKSVEAPPAPSQTVGPLVRCPFCANDIPEGRRFCPNCGEELAAYVHEPVPPPVWPERHLATATPTGLPVARFAAIGGLLAIATVAFLILRSNGGGAGGGGAPSQPTSRTPQPTIAGGYVVGDYFNRKPMDVKDELASLCDPRPCVSVMYLPGKDGSVPFGLVIKTDRAPGARVQQGEKVDVIVSVGHNSPNGEWYEVSEGDKFSCIANAKGWNPAALLEPYNPIVYDSITPGELIWIPADPPTLPKRTC